MPNYMALGINKREGDQNFLVLIPFLVDWAPLVRGV